MEPSVTALDGSDGSDLFRVDTTELLTNPARSYAQLRTRPVRRVREPGGMEFWMVTGYQEAQAALHDRRLSNDPRHLGRAAAGIDGLAMPLINNDPPAHTRLRRLISRELAPRRVERLRGRILSITHELLDEMAPRGRADLIRGFAFSLPALVVSELIGVPADDRDTFRDWAARLFDVSGAPVTSQQRSHRLRGYFAQLLAERRAVPDDETAAAPPDLLGSLIKAGQRGDAVSEPEIVDLMIVVLVAGLETTTNLIANGTAALLRDPGQLALVRDERAIAPTAIEELLRYEGSAGHAAIRVAVEDVTIGGTTIPAGSLIQVSLAGANRDPAYFDDADRLDVTRTRNPHLAFGHGIHFCVGAALARLQGKIAVQALLDRFPDITLGCPPEDLVWKPVSVLHRLAELPVVFAPELPAPAESRRTLPR